MLGETRVRKYLHMPPLPAQFLAPEGPASAWHACLDACLCGFPRASPSRPLAECPQLSAFLCCEDGHLRAGPGWDTPESESVRAGEGVWGHTCRHPPLCAHTWVYICVHGRALGARLFMDVCVCRYSCGGHGHPGGHSRARGVQGGCCGDHSTAGT